MLNQQGKMEPRRLVNKRLVKFGLAASDLLIVENVERQAERSSHHPQNGACRTGQRLERRQQSLIQEFVHFTRREHRISPR